MKIKKTYLTDENNKPLAVQIDIKTFERMELLLEDYALGRLIEENDSGENLSIEEARALYKKLKD